MYSKVSTVYMHIVSVPFLIVVLYSARLLHSRISFFCQVLISSQCEQVFPFLSLVDRFKGLAHQTYFKYCYKNGQNYAEIRGAAGFCIF